MRLEQPPGKIRRTDLVSYQKKIELPTPDLIEIISYLAHSGVVLHVEPFIVYYSSHNFTDSTRAALILNACLEYLMASPPKYFGKWIALGHWWVDCVTVQKLDVPY